MTAIRKFHFTKERVLSEGTFESERPITRVAGVAVFENPFPLPTEDLSALFTIGEAIGAMLTTELLAMLPFPVESYGKAAMVGSAGDLEYGHALLHPRLGRPMREQIGGGNAIIPSNAKVCECGGAIDVPIGHKDDVWRFSHFDTITVCVPDAPRFEELALIVALADGGRPAPRIGLKK